MSAPAAPPTKRGGPTSPRGDTACVPFLEWALPRLQLRWRGFRNVRGQVCKRVARRLDALGLPDFAAYRARLEADPAEWDVLDGLCVVTISRFYRNHVTWNTLRDEVLPTLAEAALAAGEDTLRCWSIGCASGEEPYTLAIVWELALRARYPGLRLRVLATDVDDAVLARARAGEYPEATLRELPPGWADAAFERQDGARRLRDRFRASVELRHANIRLGLPDETFRLVLCRNMVLTYFDEALQRETLARVCGRLASGGAFVAGPHERPPVEAPLTPWRSGLGIFRRA